MWKEEKKLPKNVYVGEGSLGLFGSEGDREQHGIFKNHG